MLTFSGSQADPQEGPQGDMQGHPPSGPQAGKAIETFNKMTRKIILLSIDTDNSILSKKKFLSFLVDIPSK